MLKEIGKIIKEEVVYQTQTKLDSKISERGKKVDLYKTLNKLLKTWIKLQK